METASKTTVQIIQELIAIHVTRKEAAERLPVVPGDKDRLDLVKKQSTRFITALMNELSAFGDAVTADTDRNNPYIKMWNDVLPETTTITPSQASKIFYEMETVLLEFYRGINAGGKELSAPLQQLLQEQDETISATASPAAGL